MICTVRIWTLHDCVIESTIVIVVVNIILMRLYFKQIIVCTDENTPNPSL